MSNSLAKQIAELIYNPLLKWTAPDCNGWVQTKYNQPTQFASGAARDKLILEQIGYLPTISLTVKRLSELFK